MGLTERTDLQAGLGVHQEVAADIVKHDGVAGAVLLVQGPDKNNANSYMYGERGVLLIAGIDDQLHLDNVCINQSLLIALFIFWLICQVALLFGCGMVLQRYRRLAKLEDERRRLHEEYLEARRVHWADQGGYTL